MLNVQVKWPNMLIRMERFSEDVLECIKSLPFREYKPQDRVWVVPIFEYELLQKKLSNKGLELPELPAVQTNIELDTSNLRVKPYSHQVEGAQFLLKTRKCILADEMGCGKTLTAIIAASHTSGKKLIICPASLKLNWAKEIKNALATYGKINILGNSALDPDAEWYIINYDMLEKYRDSLESTEFDCAIVDEAHYIKAVTNSGKPASKRAEIVLDLLQGIPYVFLLTGTPITSRPKDLYNLLKAIEHPLGKMKFFYYGLRYCAGEKTQWGWNFDGASNTTELHKFVAPYMLRRTKDQVLDLPPKTRHFVPVEVNLKEYKQKLKEFVEARNITMAETLVMLNAMKKLLAEQKVNQTIEFAQNIIEEEGSVVIFTIYKSVIEKLREKFENNCVVVDGETPQQKRQEAVELFQTGKVDVFIGNMLAAGVGLTLTRAKSMIINDFDWVPATHIQSEDRIHRISQTDKVNIYYLYADGAEIEEYIVNVLEKKLDIIERIVDGERKRKVKSSSMLDDIINSLRRCYQNDITVL